MDIQQITWNDQLFALIIYNQSQEEGVRFFTPDDNALQVGKHFYQSGKIIKPHCHCPIEIASSGSPQEVLYIQEGKVRVTFYTREGKKIDSKILSRGDILLLREGGHGFEFLEKTEMLEIKQGPYNPESKKPLEVKNKL